MHVKHSNDCLQIYEAVEKLKNNKDFAFNWFPVINKHGNKFELHGNYERLKAIVPYYNNDGSIVYHRPPFNDYSSPKYSISTHYNHIDDGFSIRYKDEFIKFIEDNDLSKIKMVEEEIEVITYEIVKKWKIH